MSKVVGNLINWGTAVLSSVLVQANVSVVEAQEETIVSATPTPASQSLSQIPYVFQLADINSSDWQFQALQSLAQRYGLDTENFSGNRSLTRYKFAASLSATLTSIEQAIATNGKAFVSREDLATLQRLQTEFATELASFQKQRVDVLESQVARLEAQQFSTTTTLSGQVIFAASAAAGDEQANDSDEEVDDNLILSDRVQLNFNTSFTGEDRLYIRLQARNTPGFEDATGTDMARLGFQGDNDNEFEISRLEYRFPVGDQANVYIATSGGEFDNFTNLISPFSSSSTGAVSRFGRYNPIYRQGFGAEVGLNYDLSDAVSLNLGYVADAADDPDDGIGASPYSALAQLTLEPIDDLELGLTYIRSYNNIDTGTGSELANEPFDDESDHIWANSYGLTASWRVSSDFILGGWLGLTHATAADLPGDSNADIFNYAVTLAFPDLGKEGSLGGIVIGQPPKVTSNDLSEELSDRDTSLHLEVFYRFQATDNIAITPGLFVITNPEHNANNGTLYVGTIRTTFSF